MTANDGRDGAPVMSNGGVTGWVAVLTLFTLNVSSVGVTKGLGVLLMTLEDQLVSKSWILGWIVAVSVAISGITGKVVLLARCSSRGRQCTTGGLDVHISTYEIFDHK